MKNYYDIELHRELSKILKNDFVVDDIYPYFDKMNKLFPVKFDRYHLEKLHNYEILRWDGINYDDLSLFIHNVIKENRINEEEIVIYLGDNLSDYAYIFLLRDLNKIIHKLLSIPEQHYIINSNMSWCIFISLENDVEFARTM